MNMQLTWRDPTTPWTQWALGELGRGVAEQRVGDHPRIVFYHGHTSIGPRPDETPWCSSLLNAAFACVGIEPTRLATAASWRHWGIPCALQDGAVVWFPPGDPDAGGTGHVGLYFGGRCLGGNQANRVSLAERAWGRAGAVRWPAGLMPPKFMATVTARRLNVRIGPGANFASVPTGAVDHGTELCVRAKLGAWLSVLVAMPDGRQVPGWVHGGYAEVA